MNNDADIINSIYSHLLHRTPREEEARYWVGILEKEGHDFVLGEFLKSDERVSLAGPFPPGHYYSPINDTRNIDFSAIQNGTSRKEPVEGIDINLRGQSMTWRAMCSELTTRIRQPIANRYSLPNGTYGEGDSLIQKGMILSHGSRQIIEVGSGFSSASMLDCSEEYGLGIEFTFIEPYPQTLLALVSEKERENLIQEKVQLVDLSVFQKLNENDILFIDSSHVLKSQSDVHFELFDILPSLKSGVLIHFHDVFWPFEYPVEWIKSRGYSWNELYALRAFLSYNYQFEIVFWNDAFNSLCVEEIDKSPDFIKDEFRKNPGGGLWLRKR